MKKSCVFQGLASCSKEIYDFLTVGALYSKEICNFLTVAASSSNEISYFLTLRPPVLW